MKSDLYSKVNTHPARLYSEKYTFAVRTAETSARGSVEPRLQGQILRWTGAAASVVLFDNGYYCACVNGALVLSVGGQLKVSVTAWHHLAAASAVMDPSWSDSKVS
jgi:hypothetical protein